MSSPRLRWTTGVAAIVCVASVIAADRLATPPGARLYLPAEAHIGADDQVVMLDAYYYEIPFYWKLKQTTMVVSDWQDPALPLHDNWRNELSDAGHFEPSRAARTLVNRVDLPRLLCVPRRTWLVGSSASVSSGGVVMVAERSTGRRLFPRGERPGEGGAQLGPAGASRAIDRDTPAARSAKR